MAYARNALLTLSIVFVVLALTVARPPNLWGPLLRDFEAYWSAGNVYDAGGDPYGRDIWRAERTVPGVDPGRDEMLPFISPPATLPLYGAVARLSYDVASRVWWVVLVSALGGLIVGSLHLAGRRVDAFSFFCCVAFAIGFAPVTGNLALGQIAIVAFLGSLVAAISGSLPRKTLASFVACFQPNVALGLLSQLGRNRTTLAMAAGSVLAYAAGAFVLGWAWPLHYVALVRTHQSGERFSAIQITPGAIAYGLHLSNAAVAAVSLAAGISAVVAGVVLSRRIADPLPRFAAVSCLVPFVASFFHEHDYIVAFPAAIWCAINTRGTTRLAALVGTMLVAIDWYGLAQRPEAMAQIALLACAALLAFVALGTELELPVVARAAVPVAVIFTAGAWAGATHPMPTWPYKLGAYHAPPNVDVATVWLQEQTRNGLEAAVPAWALMRSLTLAGCALLAYAVAKCPRPSYYRTAKYYSDGSS